MTFNDKELLEKALLTENPEEVENLIQFADTLVTRSILRERRLALLKSY